MSRILAVCMLVNLILVFNSFAQDDEDPKSIEIHFEELYKKWHELEPGLEDYEGFKQYCVNKKYKNTVDDVVRKIHHYDSIILSKANDPAYEMNSRERAKILKEISKFETKFSTHQFMKTLKRECHERHEIEHDKKISKGEFADASYDGQKIVLETELYRYSRQITKRIDHINNYLHHLNLREVLD